MVIYQRMLQHLIILHQRIFKQLINHRWRVFKQHTILHRRMFNQLVSFLRRRFKQPIKLSEGKIQTTHRPPLEKAHISLRSGQSTFVIPLSARHFSSEFIYPAHSLHFMPTLVADLVSIFWNFGLGKSTPPAFDLCTSSQVLVIFSSLARKVLFRASG
jgi:hypothetical protein